jgi:magnesium transporter
MEVFDNYLFIVLRMLSYNEEENIIDSEQVSMIIGSGFVISLQEKEEDVLDPLRERLRKGKGRIRKVGADYLAYAILDVIADNYFLLLEKLGEQMEDFEDRLLNGPDQETLKQLYILKRETFLLRKSVWPMREVVTQLERADSPLIMDQTVPFLRDLHDHTIRIIETVETHREMTAGLIELYLSINSNKMNEVMKVLTIIATIFIPLTFIAGVYGMNFANMPELEWPWAYFTVLLIMFAIGAGMIYYFRTKKWL